MKITREEIHKASSENGGWKKAQLELLGISWPPKPGWINRTILKEFEEEKIIQFKEFNIKKEIKKETDNNQLSLF